MTTNDKVTSDQAADAPNATFPLEPMNMLFATTQMQAAWMTNMLKRQREVFRFLDRRYTSDLALLEAISHAASMDQVFSAVTDFGRAAVVDYTQTSKSFNAVDMGELWGTATSANGSMGRDPPRHRRGRAESQGRQPRSH